MIVKTSQHQDRNLYKMTPDLIKQNKLFVPNTTDTHSLQVSMKFLQAIHVLGHKQTNWVAGVIGVSIRSKLSFISSCVVAGKEEENPCVWILTSTLLNKSWRQNLDGNEMIEGGGESLQSWLLGIEIPEETYR